jgi:uncharacterized protein involved in exopolysaccharide biosynthesis
MKEKQIELEAEGWTAIAGRDQQVEALERALAAATTELEDARLTIMDKDILIGELQQRVKELVRELQVIRSLFPLFKEF